MTYFTFTKKRPFCWCSY